ncbi:gastricsin [Thraustotheca clavata]|uniref:Gastricsin n=1 Tax=Thraustotheca clavata TaxID=74557 RepID=A0A1V9Y6Z7_9STRA|nr:gastricsin [Thraustotheca clavata]
MLVLLLCFLCQVLAFDRINLPLTRQPISRRLISSGATVTVQNHLATQYSVSISIDGNSYNVQVDTGSADLWVVCSAKKNVACLSTCPTNGVQIYYGSGNACLVPTVGSVQLGNVAISNGIYGVGMSNSVLTNSTDTSGILGLAFPVLSTFNTSNQSYLISHLDSFSMYLTSKSDEEGSSLILNGVDEDLIKKNSLVPVTIPIAVNQTSHWNVLLSGFSMDSNTTAPCKNTASGCIAVVDSGTTFLSMPRFLFNQFAQKYLLAQQCTWQTSYYVCSKDVTLPRLGFTLNGTTFYLNSWDYSMVYSETQILIQLQLTPPGGSSGDRWILGDTFLKVYYTSYLVSQQAIVFYCPNGNCNGGTNILDFSRKTKGWALGLFIGGGCLVGLALVGLLVYYFKKRKGQTTTPGYASQVA